MQPTSHAFKEQAASALHDQQLRRALLNMKPGFQDRRARTIAKLPEFEALRDQAKGIKNHTLENLAAYLERFERKAVENGAQVHWARTPEEARQAVLGICRSVGARLVTKGKSMATEEIGLNGFLEQNGLKVVETDLGEYIIQLRREPPSHIIAPALHLTKDQIADSFRAAHPQFDAERPLSEPRALTDEARAVLRQKYQDADVGITGANFLVAETGSTVIVTNEGNGDLTQTLAPVHVVVATIEKVIPTLEDATAILRLLARSATGQEFSAYTTFSTGPKRPDDSDGPEQFHVVIVDNGRSALLGTEVEETLRCIRCGACMNHCPVYGAIGGHAYGWVVPGPIGAALDPGLIGIKEAHHLPNASTFCGRCESVCPMKIPLTTIMRYWRVKEFEEGLSPAAFRRGLRLWAWAAKHPSLYRLGSRIAVGVLGRFGRRRGRFRSLPMASGWTAGRDMPAPEGTTFHALWARRRQDAA